MKETKCCDKCDARQYPPVLGAHTCWDDKCECHVSNKVANKEDDTCHSEEKKCWCGDAFGKCPLSPSDKTWEYTMKTIGKISNIHPEIVDEFILITNQELTSATIKAREEVLREMLLYRKSFPQITTKENILDFIVSFANEKSINLEEPSK